jgi:hypothetical protein
VLQSCAGLLEEVCSKHSALLVGGLVQAALGASDTGLLEVVLELAGLMMRGGGASIMTDAFIHRCVDVDRKAVAASWCEL